MFAWKDSRSVWCSDGSYLCADCAGTGGQNPRESMADFLWLFGVRNPTPQRPLPSPFTLELQ